MSQSCEARDEAGCREVLSREGTLLGVHHGPKAGWGGYIRCYAVHGYSLSWPSAPDEYLPHRPCSAGGPALSLLQHRELLGKHCFFHWP